MKNPYKALQAIEVLVSSDFGFDMGALRYQKNEVGPTLLEAARVITKIYQIAHSEKTSGSCKHLDWEEIKYDILSKYNKSKI